MLFRMKLCFLLIFGYLSSLIVRKIDEDKGIYEEKGLFIMNLV